ncbi:MAG: hypothetical protein AAF685_09190 [Cyanobacteria bacterium P01_C01_bin.89]
MSSDPTLPPDSPESDAIAPEPPESLSPSEAMGQNDDDPNETQQDHPEQQNAEPENSELENAQQSDAEDEELEQEAAEPVASEDETEPRVETDQDIAEPLESSDPEPEPLDETSQDAAELNAELNDNDVDQDQLGQDEVISQGEGDQDEAEADSAGDDGIQGESFEGVEGIEDPEDGVIEPEESAAETWDGVEEVFDGEEPYGDGGSLEGKVAAIEMVPPGPIRRSLAWVLKALVRVLSWVITELEAEDIRQRPGTANSLEDRLTISKAELERLTPFRQILRRVLLNLRSLLPGRLRTISDRNLGLIVATVVVVGGWSLVGDILPKPAPMPEPAIAQIPEPPVATTPEPDIPEAPQLPDVVEITPEPETVGEETNTGELADSGEEVESEEVTEEGAIAEEPALEDELDAEDEDTEAAAEEQREIDTEAPVLEMTPEQTLIAAIQDQVVDTAQRYGDSGIVQSIQADFRRGRLLVRINADQWFELAAVEQDRMAADLFGRSLNLNFNKLEITSVDGLTLARSPVVGDAMIILQRNGVIL